MFIQDTLNLDIIFYSEQNQRDRSTAAQCWYTSTRGGVSAWFWRELELQETRPFKGESVCVTPPAGSSLRQSFEDGVDLLSNSSQGEFKLVLKKQQTNI